MDARARPYDFTLIAVGAITAAAGAYLVMIGLDLVPPPSRINGPYALATAAGVAFLLGGICVALRGYLGMDDKQREVPPDAPLWAKLVFWLGGIGITVSLAAIGTWIAFGPGDRGFGVSGAINGPVSDELGRAIFGTGAIMTWLAVIVFARAGYRKVFGK